MATLLKDYIYKAPIIIIIMAKAVWKGKTIAESEKYEIVESNIYFPPDSVKKEYLVKSGNTYKCSWKGLADYYNIKINGDVNEDAAWIYPNPEEKAKNIKGYFAFWKGVEVTK